MSRTVGVFTLGILAVSALLAGCGEEPKGRTESKEDLGNAEATFDVDDVPSLNLPADQREAGKLWCQEHHRYEDECYICHPDLIPKAATAFDVDDVPSLNLPVAQREPGRLWCKEHNRYEDECYVCHPDLIPTPSPAPSSAPEQPSRESDKNELSGRANISGAASVLMCNDHNVPEIECGICQSERLAGLSVGEGMKIRFASEQSTSKAGVQTGYPAESSVNAAQEMLGQVSFNRNQLAMVTPLGGGVITDVLKDVGESVEKGEVLAIVHSRDIAEARSQYLRVLAESELARQTLVREQDLHEQEISAKQDLELAQAAAAVARAAVSESRQHLHNLGLSDEEIENASRPRNDSSSLPVRAPFAGIVIERNAVLGTAVEPGQALYAVADLSTMWMNLSISETHLSSIRVGSLVRAKFEAYDGISFDGEITWIAPTVDPETRMLQARVLLANPQGLLKDGLFGRASLAGYADQNALSVPKGAVQDVDGKAVVFRKLEDDLFETRLIATGAGLNESILVLAGLAADDEIVIEGSYIVKSELLKARLGAGCTDD